MPPKKSLIEKNVSMVQKENAINKKVGEYSLRAIKKMKNDFREKPSIPIKYGKNSLFDKIISSNMKDNEINKRLEQISYSAINGDRQKEETYKPEGVQMLGTLGREKPLAAITKEMIKEYQEAEEKPYIIDGEARKYMGTDFKPLFQIPQSLDDIRDDFRDLYKDKLATIKTLTDAEENINALDDYYRGLIRDINVFGLTDAKRNDKIKAERDMLRLRNEYDKLKKDLEKIEYEMKRMFDLGKEIKKENALIPQKNKEEIMKYEEALKSVNQNRLNVQQQPNESDDEYYQRLRDIEKQKYNPILYEKFSINKVSKELKPKLEGLFKDEGMIENIIKSLSTEEKMIVNKNFNKIEEDFIKKHGFNPSMNSKMAIKEMLSSFEDPATRIKAAIKRINAQNLYIPVKQKKDAIDKLESVFLRSQNEPRFAEALELSREMEDEDNARFKKNMLSTREKQQKRMDKLARERQEQDIRKNIRNEREGLFKDESDYLDEEDLKILEREGAKKIQKAFKGYQVRKQAKDVFAKEQAIKRDYKKGSTRQKQQEKMDELAREENKKQEAIKALALASGKIKSASRSKYIRDLYSKGLVQYMRPLQKIQGALKRIQPEPTYIREQLKETSLINEELKRIGAEQKEIDDERERIKKLGEIRLKRALTKGIRERSKPKPSPIPSSLLSGADTEQEAIERMSLRFPRSDIGASRMPYATNKNVKNALLIQSAIRGNLARKKMREEARNKLIEENEQERQALEIEEARAMLSPKRAKRSDAGKERAKYDTQKARERAFLQELTPEEKKFKNVSIRAGKTIPQVVEEIKKNRAKEGSGIRRIKRIPAKISKISKIEKDARALASAKNRLRLIIGSYQSGNDNPKLIKELNTLYKKLYGIDNAVMIIRK